MSTRSEQLPAKTLALNEVGFCNLAAHSADRVRSLCAKTAITGAFILIDRYHQCDGRRPGMIDFGLRRATNVHVQELTVTQARRARG